MQVRLEGDAHVGVLRAQGLVEVEGALGVRAALHVDPEKAPRVGGRSREPQQVGISRVGVDVEAELRRLDGNLGLHTGGRCEDLFVVLDDTVRVREVGDVFAQEREQRADAPGLEVRRRLQSGLKALAWKKPLDRAPRKAPARDVGRQPPIPGGPQEQRSHREHKVYERARVGARSVT